MAPSGNLFIYVFFPHFICDIGVKTLLAHCFQSPLKTSQNQWLYSFILWKLLLTFLKPVPFPLSFNQPILDILISCFSKPLWPLVSLGHLKYFSFSQKPWGIFTKSLFSTHFFYVTNYLQRSPILKITFVTYSICPLILPQKYWVINIFPNY